MFIPDSRNKNSYQVNLSDALKGQGVSVYFGDDVVGTVIRHKPNIIHVHWPNYFMVGNTRIATIVKSIRFISGLLTLKLFGVKIVWTVHNITDHEAKFKSLESLFSKYLAKFCNRLIVHCPSAKKDVITIYGKDSSSIDVVPHGNYIGWYKNNITDLEARNILKINQEDIVFLYFGQIRSYKGVPQLINEFKKLNCDSAKLLIVGKPLNETIAKDILDSCKEDKRIKAILDFIPADEIQTYMNASDIVVLPYKDILTSGAAILSMSFGKPIIAPKIRCIADTLDEKGSFLYKEDLIESMQKVLNTDKDTLQTMGKHNLELAKKFGWDEIGIETQSIYGKLFNTKDSLRQTSQIAHISIFNNKSN